MRRIVAAAAPKKLGVRCPWVHATPGVRPCCERCFEPFTKLELREYALDCNGDERCSQGVHVPRLCERCVGEDERDGVQL